MFDVQVIKKLAEEKHMKLIDLAQKAGITNSGLHALISKGDTKCTTIAKIAQALEVPVGTFFDEDPALYTYLGAKYEAAYNECVKERDHLRTVMLLKDEMIKMLKSQIEGLTKD